MGFCINCGADPLVRAGRSRPACSVEESSTSETGRVGQGGPVADEGVRPTTYADARLWEILAVLPLRSRFGERIEVCPPSRDCLREKPRQFLTPRLFSAALASSLPTAALRYQTMA
jgi:hypothetical protein